MSYASDLAQNALAGIISSYSSRSADQTDTADVSYDTEGASHQEYKKMLADKEAAKTYAAESAARQAQIEKDYATASAWSKQQTAALDAQTAAMGNTGTTGTTAGATAASTGPPSLWKSYEQYWRDKGEWDLAKDYSGYHTTGSDPRTGDNSRWGKSGNPYRFTYEYDNDYLNSLPAGQKATAKAGVGPEWVTGGFTNRVLVNGKEIPIEGADYYWQNTAHQQEYAAAQKAQQAQWAAASGGSGSGAPVRPTGKVSWQDDQKYWRDLDAYNKAHKLGAYR